MSRRYNKFDKYREKFFRVPKVFTTNEKYKKMSNDAKMAFAILQDRQELSIKNNWFDEKGDIFFVYSNPKLVEILGLSVNTVTKVKKELKKAELLEEVPTGRASHFYLLMPEVTEDDIYLIDKSENATGDKPEDVELEEEVDQALENLLALEPEEVHKNCEARITKSVKQVPKNYDSDSQNLTPNDTDLKEKDLRETDYKENLNLNLNHMNEYIWQLRVPMSLKKFFSDKVKDLVNDKTFDISEIEYFYNTYKEYIDPHCTREDTHAINDIEFSKAMKKMYLEVSRPISNMEGLLKSWVQWALHYKIENNEDYKSMPY